MAGVQAREIGGVAGMTHNDKADLRIFPREQRKCVEQIVHALVRNEATHMEDETLQLRQRICSSVMSRPAVDVDDGGQTRMSERAIRSRISAGQSLVQHVRAHLQLAISKSNCPARARCSKACRTRSPLARSVPTKTLRGDVVEVEQLAFTQSRDRGQCRVKRREVEDHDIRCRDVAQSDRCGPDEAAVIGGACSAARRTSWPRPSSKAAIWRQKSRGRGVASLNVTRNDVKSHWIALSRPRDAYRRDCRLPTALYRFHLLLGVQPFSVTRRRAV